jgi:hypothetical protein
MDSPETLASLGTQKQDGDKEIKKKTHTQHGKLLSTTVYYPTYI